MQKRGISQETLKLIACLTMLIDHIGAALIPSYMLRAIGRLSFPIYCFLLAEGADRTRNPGKYTLRLVIGMLLSELPYDLLFYGGWSWRHQNVMLTLLLGFCALRILRWQGNGLLKLAGIAALALTAQLLHTDYGMNGVLLIVLFGIARDLPEKWLLQLIGMLLIFDRMSSPKLFSIAGLGVTLQMLGAISIVPISLYSGHKATNSKAVQWGFYLFYPVHLLALYIIRVMMYG